MPAPRVESAAVLVVDDVHAASLSVRQRVRPSTSDRRPRLPHELAGGDDEPRRTVRRATGGGLVGVRGIVRSVPGGSILVTWVTDYSGDMGNTVGPNGFSIGSRGQVSSSNDPQQRIARRLEPPDAATLSPLARLLAASPLVGRWRRTPQVP